MRNLFTLAIIASVLLAQQAQASLFLEYMNIFLAELDFTTFKNLLAWQMGGLAVPLLAGPLRSVAYVFWYAPYDVDTTADMVKAWLFVDYDIVTVDDFTNYLVDWIVYGKIYALVGFETSFPEIPLQDVDKYYVACFDYNNYDYENDPDNDLPFMGTLDTSLAGGYDCGTEPSRRPNV